MSESPVIRMGRRRFLGLAAAGAVAAVTTATTSAATSAGRAAQSRRQIFASCGADRDGGYLVSAFDAAGEIVFRTPLPERGHDLALRPDSAELVAFARRPGGAMHVVDAGSGAVLGNVGLPRDRRCYGHGVFAPDGRALFVTENDFEAGRGAIGIYDPVDGYRRIGELESHGVGPHQLLLMPDGRTLAVANGGIRTHPDFGRNKLGISDMAPNLAFVDAASGRLLERRQPPERLHKLSIRHVAVNAAGTLAVAMQYEGDRRDEVPLVALVRPGGELRLLGAEPMGGRMRHYTGAVCFDGSGGVVAVSAPRGNLVGLWDADSGRLLGRIPSADSSGIAPAGPGRFVIAGGDGAIRMGGVDGPPVVVRPPGGGVRWDNHVAVASV